MTQKDRVIRVARRRKGRDIHGVLVLDKPRGITSNACLQRAKRALYAAKAGHTGSLDPLATGVLPLCFGEATKLSRFLLDADKEYDSTFVLGVTTSTGDAEGEVVAQADASEVTRQEVEQLLTGFRGEIEQTPPMYSALKHQGQPLYKLARAGIEVERKSRRVTIYGFEILDFEAGQRAHLKVNVRCSKGTYIRSLAEDIGKLLGCGGHVSELRRTRAGNYALEQCIGLDKLEQLAAEQDLAQLKALMLPVDSAIAGMPTVVLPEVSGYYLRQGQAVLAAHMPTTGLVRIVEESGEFLGVGEILDDGRLTPRRLMVSTEALKASDL
jgi:tRNA pseudouridine55 synthase